MISKPTLALLNCLVCNQPIPAELEEVGWVCNECGAVSRISLNGLHTPLEINHSADIPQGQIGRAFWVVPGEVLMRNRATINDDLGTLLIWDAPLKFFVPAYSLPLDELLTISRAYLFSPPNLNPGPPVKFEPFVLLPEDLKPYIEFLVISLEAEATDMLKSLDFDVNLSDPQLWVLP